MYLLPIFTMSVVATGPNINKPIYDIIVVQ